MAREYDLPRLAPLAEYGPWQRAYPHLACGVKRGFTFFQHEEGRPFSPRPDRANELLVGANPSDDAADTHWFREHVDHFLLTEAQALGASYHDRTEMTAVAGGPGDWSLSGRREGEAVELTRRVPDRRLRPGGALTRAFGVPTDSDDLLTNSWSVYSHFADVERFESLYRASGGDAAVHPYPCDDAALHHVLTDGWVFVLRFNNGLTSAGPVMDGTRRRPNGDLSPEAEWQAVLGRYPSLAEQFAAARPVRPFVRTRPAPTAGAAGGRAGVGAAAARGLLPRPAIQRRQRPHAARRRTAGPPLPRTVGPAVAGRRIDGV